MKKIILIMAHLLPVVAIAQNNFKLNCKVGKLNAPAKAYLYYGKVREQIVDSATIKDGRFTFTGQIDSEGMPQRATLEIIHDPAVSRREVLNDVRPFYLEAKTLEIVSATDSVKYAVLKGGSKMNNDFSKLNALLQKTFDKNTLLRIEYNKKTRAEVEDPAYLKNYHEREEKVQLEMAEKNREFYQANYDSYIALIAFRNSINIENDPDGVEKQLKKFTDSLQNTDLGKNINKEVAAARITAIGQPAMDFTQNDLNGKPVKLSDFRGKYVLIDFWASWCSPCRAENPNLVKAYQQFKDKNFVVIGVSLDNPGKQADWEAAVKKDGLEWINVSDLKGWNNEVARMYGVRIIPTNFLIGPDGKIVAKRLRGEVLHNKLAEVLTN